MKILRIHWGKRIDMDYIDNYSTERVSEEQIQKFVEKYEKYLETGEAPFGAKIVAKSSVANQLDEIIYRFEEVFRVMIYEDGREGYSEVGRKK